MRGKADTFPVGAEESTRTALPGQPPGVTALEEPPALPCGPGSQPGAGAAEPPSPPAGRWGTAGVEGKEPGGVERPPEGLPGEEQAEGQYDGEVGQDEEGGVTSSIVICPSKKDRLPRHLRWLAMTNYRRARMRRKSTPSDPPGHLPQIRQG